MVERNWSGNVTFAATDLLRPTSVEQLQQIVAGRPVVRALGTRHSFSRVADTTGVLVTTGDLDVPIEVHGDAVTVGSGTRFGELAVELHRRKRALPTLGSLPHISVAGAAATGTHGSGSGSRCLAASATAVEFVAADGSLVQLRQGEPGFGGAVLSLGAIGIVTTLTLATVPTYDIRQDVWLDADLPRLLDRLDDVLDAAYSVSIFSTWRRPGVADQIWVKSEPGDERFDGSVVGARPATVDIHPDAEQDPANATPQLGTSGPWYERLPHFRLGFTPSNGDEVQSEYMIDRSHGAAAIAAIAALDLGDVLRVSEIRTVAADGLWLSPCTGRETLALHFTWAYDDARVARAVGAVEDALAPFDARPHWGKVFAADPTWHRPALPAFRELLDRYDPNRKFGNEFLQRYVYD